MMTHGNSGVASRVLRVALGVLLLATVVRVWVGPVMGPAEVHAQIPDAGTQRLEALRITRRTNELLEQLLTTLRTRTLKVEIVGTDNTNASKVRRHSQNKP